METQVIPKKYSICAGLSNWFECSNTVVTIFEGKITTDPIRQGESATEKRDAESDIFFPRLMHKIIVLLLKHLKSFS